MSGRTTPNVTHNAVTIGASCVSALIVAAYSSVGPAPYSRTHRLASAQLPTDHEPLPIAQSASVPGFRPHRWRQYRAHGA